LFVSFDVSGLVVSFLDKVIFVGDVLFCLMLDYISTMVYNKCLFGDLVSDFSKFETVFD